LGTNSSASPRDVLAVQGLIDSWVDSLRPGALPGHVDLRAPAQGMSWGEALAQDSVEPNGKFLNFRLLSELGRGAFGRVFLARQDDLAQRLVVLKISAEVSAESHNLAQLQHTNIVPVYSMHRAGALQAVCMPYFGSATLADVLHDIQKRPTPPTSGKGLVSTIQERVNRTRASLDKQKSGILPAVAPSAHLAGDRPPSSSASEPTGAGPPSAGPEASTVRLLGGLSHVDAVLWIGECLAGGLAHAHERGILHRDLKPANVLLTDDGQPMLLDFNLSADIKGDVSRARVGGTLPYMAPEHLASFAGLAAPFPPGGDAPAEADARCDVYSLGVLLFELLTGRAPFGQPGPGDSAAKMIRGRLGQPPRAARFNRGVSPAVESILQHCLEPDPARRYQSARELAEDLQRQRTHCPLAHAREGSLREQGAKWLRRNRRIAALAVGLFAAIVIVWLGGRSIAHTRQLGQMEAAATLSAFHAEHDEAHLYLAARPEDSAQRREGLRIASRALARYGVLEQPAWQAQPAFRRLPPPEQQRLVQAIGELLLLTASIDESGPRARKIELASACFSVDRAPRALHVQQADLALAQGNRARALVCRQAARRQPIRNAMDHYLLARELIRSGEDRKAVEHLRAAVRLDPRHFGAWFLLGNCGLGGAVPGLGESEAVRCYTVCVALQPLFYGSYYNRGLAQLRQKVYAEAEADFSTALKLRPKLPEGYLHRGLALEGQEKLGPALADLTRALELEGAPTRIFFARARVRHRLEDRAGAQRDQAEGLRRPPRDEESCIVRGIVRAATDPRGALEDFREAVRLNPRSLQGLYNQAYILSERLGRPQEAIGTLDRVIAGYPHLPGPRVGRGVLLARLGRRESAHKDGRKAVELASDSREILYQAACIHALTARSNADDRQEAFRLLTRALQLGFGHDRLATDSDLASLRTDPRFRKFVAGAGAGQARTAPGL
jgi:serine/threonine protein kinase/tetratricopeptide (TPR) repeat protein